MRSKKYNDLWFDYDLSIFNSKYWKIFRFAWKDSLAVKNQVINEIGHAHSRVYYWLDMIYSYFRYGAATFNYSAFRFYEKNASYRNSFLTFRRYIRLIQTCFDWETHLLFKCKDRFNSYYSRSINRKWMKIDSSVQRKDIVDFISCCAGGGIIKPLDAMQGKGVYRIYANEIEKMDELMNDLNQGHIFLIEQIVENIGSLKSLNPSSLNTVRVNTFVDKHGNLSFLNFALRVGGNGAVVDNFSAGGVVYPIDKNTGCIVGYGLDKNNKRYSHHPSTGVQMLGFQIPGFNELKSFVSDAASLNPMARFVGWDVAITENGFELIEGNFASDETILQLDGVGKYEYILRNW